MKNQFNPQLRQQLSLDNYEVLHQHLLRLSWRQQLVIQLRFWEKYSIFQIAHTMGISWRAADELIEMAILNLKAGLTENSTKTAVLKAA
ncbi:MAG: sigma factor-like helix-turn-helix DNA-binding protein [Pseudomonadota bacterium]|nr:sigma factor-like helix-turn-helix DNA-binding protein [Pseudomonadota bacterium]